jgi:NADPH:quinone reductase-like Zn-dependent oxidoreductase
MAIVVQYREIGGPEVLELAEIPTPTPDKGELLVEVKAVGVNPLDCKLRSGKRPSAPITEPRRLGSDGAGTIVSIGSGVDGWRIGDAVIIHGGSGTYATHVLVTPAQITKKPDDLDWATAAAIGIPVTTAYQAVASLGVGHNDVFLIHGGSGTVGQAAIQFAVRKGARVLATTSAAKSDLVRALGAEPILYGDGLLARAREAAPDGVDLILDIVGTDEAIATSLELVDDPQKIGTLVVGARAAELGIRAWSGGNPIPLSHDELALRAEAVPIAADLLSRGELRVALGTEYPLSEVVEAHSESESGHPAGKIILRP